ncbi:shikimate kinase/3-dehydroquinate synthase [Lysobacter sp. HA35]
MNRSRNWVLVGPTGAGKSTVGALFAARRGLRFVDLDALIEAQAGRRVAEIFATDGEAAFRQLESSALADALTNDGVVIATGGGVVLDEANRRRMRESARVVHLHAEIASQLDRLRDATDRPLLARADRDEVLRDMAARRTPLYAGIADLRIDTALLDADEVAELLHASAPVTASDTAPRHVDVESPRGPYPIHIGAGLLADGAALASAIRGRHVLVVTDANVARLYLPVLDATLRRIRPDAHIATLVLPPGESEKTLDRWREAIDALAKLGATRDATVVALGGGVIGDLAGFAAACWMRGVDVVQLPTTLLAMVDSSVGGKTAVDLPAGKNLVGAFHPPSAVIADTSTLATLPTRELRAGLAEVVKYGAIFDAGFLDWIEARVDLLLSGDATATAEAVERSCRYKAKVVARDPFERGDRALLNFGHTFGHAIETEQGYAGAAGGLVHGEAVAVGMVLAARLSAALGRAPLADAERLERLLASLGLPTRIPAGLEPPALLDRMRLDKKADAAGLRFILWDGAGHGRIVRDVPDAEVLDVLAAG